MLESQIYFKKKKITSSFECGQAEFSTSHCRSWSSWPGPTPLPLACPLWKSGCPPLKRSLGVCWRPHLCPVEIPWDEGKCRAGKPIAPWPGIQATPKAERGLRDHPGVSRLPLPPSAKELTEGLLLLQKKVQTLFKNRHFCPFLSIFFFFFKELSFHLRKKKPFQGVLNFRARIRGCLSVSLWEVAF